MFKKRLEKFVVNKVMDTMDSALNLTENIQGHPLADKIGKFVKEKTAKKNESRESNATEYIDESQTNLNAELQNEHVQTQERVSLVADVPPMPEMGGMPPMPESVPQVSYMVGVNGQQVGPCNWNKLQQMVQQGQITQQSYVWKQGMAQWQLASQIQELQPLFMNTTPQFPTNVGVMFSKEMEALIEATLEDGVLTEQEKTVLVRRAQKEGVDVDELDIYIQSLLQKRHKAQAEEDAKNDRNSKIGTLKKCPRCGEFIQSGWSACPACGFAFDIDELNNTAVKIQNDLNKISEEYRIRIAKTKGFFADENKNSLRKECATEKTQVIQNVVIGSSRKELLDMLAYTRSRANRFGPKKGYTTNSNWFEAEDFGYAYWTLFENCISAASTCFSSDPAFAQYFEFYETEKNKIKEEKNILQKIFR